MFTNTTNSMHDCIGLFQKKKINIINKYGDNMEYIYAAMILHTTEKEINEENVTKILEAAGVEVEDSRVKALIAALEDVDIEEAIETSAIAAAPAAAPAAAAPAAEEVEEEEEEEEDEEEQEEAAAAGLGALFG